MLKFSSPGASQETVLLWKTLFGDRAGWEKQTTIAYLRCLSADGSSGIWFQSTVPSWWRSWISLPCFQATAREQKPRCEIMGRNEWEQVKIFSFTIKELLIQCNSMNFQLWLFWNSTFSTYKLIEFIPTYILCTKLEIKKNTKSLVCSMSLKSWSHSFSS